MERDNPVHPGVLLKKQLQSASIKAKFVAEKIQVSNSQFGDILNGKRRITPKIALLLEQEFGYRAKEWVRLQADYELEHERLRMTNGKTGTPED